MTRARAGAGGTFQVISLKNENGQDLSYLIDKGAHFHDLDELKEAIIDGISSRLVIHEDE